MDEPNVSPGSLNHSVKHWISNDELIIGIFFSVALGSCFRLSRFKNKIIEQGKEKSEPQGAAGPGVGGVDHQVLLVPLVHDEHGRLAALVRVQHLDVADVLHAADRLNPVDPESSLEPDVVVIGDLENLAIDSILTDGIVSW